MERKYLIPGSVLFAGIVIAISVFVLRSNYFEQKAPWEDVPPRPVTVADIIIGSPEARVMMVTYSDADCTVCKEFHQTLMQIGTEYAPNKDFAWVYRHLPIVSVNSFSRTHAEASLCVKAVAGDAIAIRFLDEIRARAPGSNEFDPKNYPSIFSLLNLPQEEVQRCITSGTFRTQVQGDAEYAISKGAYGAPFSVLVTNKEVRYISGAMPYEELNKIVREALAQ